MLWDAVKRYKILCLCLDITHIAHHQNIFFSSFSLKGEEDVYQLLYLFRLLWNGLSGHS